MLFKTLKYLQDNGLDIGTDGANYIATIESVKNKYPKAK